MSMLDVLVVEVLVLTVGQAVWPSVGRSARRALNTWSGWWTGGRSNEEEPMAMAMNIQFMGEDVPQGSSLDILKSECNVNDNDDDNVQTKSARPRPRARARPRLARARPRQPRAQRQDQE